MLLLTISLVIFMEGNLLDMGLRLKLRDALGGLRNPRFVILSLLWGFVLGPALAYPLTLAVPLQAPYALGLILLGMTPCAPFLPLMVDRGRGDLGYAASFMLLSAVGTVAFMPIAVPVMAAGLSVSAWAIARPLVMVVLLPLAVGMAIREASGAFAARLQPVVKKIAGAAAIVMLVLLVVIYGEAFIGASGSFAVVTQVLFLGIVTAASYGLAFGLPQRQRSVLGLGLCTRNLGAALAPLFAASGVERRAIIMVALGVPVQVILAWLAARMFAARAGGAGGQRRDPTEATG